MRDRWYADNRDLIKWGVLLQLADSFKAQRVLQLAFYRPTIFGKLEIDGQTRDIPTEAIDFFRNCRRIGGISSKVRVTVFDAVFDDRAAYQQAILALLEAFARERCIVLLDPDIGLQPKNPTLDHVLDDEANAVWNAMKEGDVLALYQHQTNRRGRPWIDPKRSQLANALGVQRAAVKVASAPDITSDVVIFFAQRV